MKHGDEIKYVKTKKKTVKQLMKKKERKKSK